MLIAGINNNLIPLKFVLMSKKDFFRLIIKLFGLYCLITTVFQFIPAIYTYWALEIDKGTWILAAGSILLFVFIYVLLIQKVDIIINRLKLDKGFDDDYLQIGDFDSSKLVSFASILIGGFLLVDYFPRFLYQAYDLFKKKIQYSGHDYTSPLINLGPSEYDFALSIINIVIGFFLLTNYRHVAQWLTRIHEKSNP